MKNSSLLILAVHAVGVVAFRSPLFVRPTIMPSMLRTKTPSVRLIPFPNDPMSATVDRHVAPTFSSTTDNDANVVDDEELNPPPAFLVGLVGAFSHLLFRLSFMPSGAKTLSRLMLAVFMFGGAAMRLDEKAVKKNLLPMVPPPLPPKLCVYGAGVAEGISGLLLLLPQYSGLGAQLTLLTLWAVTPANIYNALSKKAREETGLTGAGIHIFRLPVQVLFFYWASWFTPSGKIVPW